MAESNSEPEGQERAVAVSSLRQTHEAGQRVLNCVPSLYREDDWSVDTAKHSGVLSTSQALPDSVDLREDWWDIRDQKDTGACVGFATADGVLRWHLVKAGRIGEDEWTSPRFIWMANKETDDITDFPTTFVESAGTQTKRALLIALRLGCLLDRDLPMTDGALWRDSAADLYSRASRLRIESFWNLGTRARDWKRWLAEKGPILTRLRVDETFLQAGNRPTDRLENYSSESIYGGHAVAIVGYGPDHFIIRNSWGRQWGDKGFAYASLDYARKAFTEAYGVVMPAGERLKPASAATQANLTEPRFEGMTIELEEGDQPPLDRAEKAARAVLGPDHDWRIEPVHASEPLDFDLLPPPGQESKTSVGEAWELAHRLKTLEAVAFAEPSFTLFQDNDPELSVAGTGPGMSEEADGDLSPAELRAAGLPLVKESWRDWSALLVRARKAWEVPPRGPEQGFAGGKSRGAGIRIGHPDSGYRNHRELFNAQRELRIRVRKDLDRDFVDNDLETMTHDGDHGLATASVIMSYEPEESGPSPADEITGIAPRADLVPLRVAKVRPVIPTPVLLRSGMIRLRKALDYGAEVAGCHVFSISLGWLWNRSLHKAIQRAVQRHNAIIVAAAGNQVRFVVWPARYRETLCIAACNYQAGKWRGSSRGSSVDVAAPGQNVWKADHERGVKKSNGTSYAAATVAGLAALWLSHWGRDYLLDRYQGIPLAEVFRFVLKGSSVRPSGWNIRKWGRGIVDGEALLKTPLPERSAVRSAMRYTSVADTAAAGSSLPHLLEAFEDLESAEILQTASSLLGIEDGTAMRGLEDEVMFHILTHPTLRDRLARSQAVDEHPSEAPIATEAIGRQSLSESLRAVLAD